jgi:rare lipoprotein A
MRTLVLALCALAYLESAAKAEIASYYGQAFTGRKTASGERFNHNAMTAAHRTLPFGTRVRVTHARTGKFVVVRINDRGPYVNGRAIDLSHGAARAIGMGGTAQVRIEEVAR